MLARCSTIVRIALLVGVWLSTTGTVAFCSFNSDPAGGVGGPDGPGTGDTFRATLLLRNAAGVVTDNFVFGESIRFDLLLENRTAREVRVQFPDAQTYDFFVFNNGTSQIRWQWSEGRAFAQVATELVFEPDSSKTFSVTWNGVLRDGTNLPPGLYEAKGLMVYEGYENTPRAPHEYASVLVPFTVR